MSGLFKEVGRVDDPSREFCLVDSLQGQRVALEPGDLDGILAGIQREPCPLPPVCPVPFSVQPEQDQPTNPGNPSRNRLGLREASNLEWKHSKRQALPAHDKSFLLVRVPAPTAEPQQPDTPAARVIEYAAASQCCELVFLLPYSFDHHTRVPAPSSARDRATPSTFSRLVPRHGFEFRDPSPLSFSPYFHLPDFRLPDHRVLPHESGIFDPRRSTATFTLTRVAVDISRPPLESTDSSRPLPTPASSLEQQTSPPQTIADHQPRRHR